MPSLKMKPVEGLVRAIRNIAAHNTSTARAYVSDAASFAVLTDAQRKQVHAAACALLGVETTTTVEALQAQAAIYTKAGRTPRFVWVHQRYAPLASPGMKRRPALYAQFAGAVAAGLIVPAAEFVETCTAAVAQKQIEQQPRRGGYILAVAQDAAAQREERKAQKPTAKIPADLAEMF
jgi:hypothetical protein